MSLVYHSTYVQQPSAAPTTNNAGTTYQIRHRRVNLDGGVSLWSTLSTTDLPATITPQSYTDSGQLLRDEILVSDDSGVTWRVYPGNTTGAQSLPAFDSSWATTSNQDTQSSVVSSLDFGTFSDTETPTKEIYVLNNGVPVNNIKVNFIDLLAGSMATSYMGLLQVAVLGTYEQSGLGSSSLYNQSFVWASPQVSLNNLELVLTTNGFIKLEISFVNYPAPNGLASASISLGMELVANQRTYFLGFGSEWLAGSYFVDQDKYVADFLSANSDTEVVVEPYLVNINGVLFTNFGNLSKTIAGVNTGYQLVVTSAGDTKIVDPGVGLAAGENLLATFDITGSSPWISNVSYEVDIKPRDFGKAGGSVAEGRFVDIDSSGNLALTSLANEAIGISLKKSGYYASSGLARVQVSEAVSVGNRLSADANGKGEITVSGPVVVLEAGLTDDLVLCNIISIQGPALASVNAGQVDADDSGWTEIGPAMDVQTALDQTDLILGGLAEKFSKKIQVFSSNGTFTVPTKYVLNTLQVEVIGAGGGGGGGGGSGADGGFHGAGGGGGGVAKKLIQGLQPGDQVTITIGTGGAAGTLNNSGTAGGTSSFGTHCSAGGGAGGGVYGDPGTGGVGVGGDTNTTLGSASPGGPIDNTNAYRNGGKGGGPGGVGSYGRNSTAPIGPGGGGGGAGRTLGSWWLASAGADGEVTCSWIEYN